MLDYSSLPLFSLQPETKEIPLSRGRVAIVDAADYEWLMQWQWKAQKNRRTWYACRRVPLNGKRKIIFMHREILGNPLDILIDHRDGDGLNNTRINLRPCTYTQNVGNQRLRIDNSSGYKGVSRCKESGKWRAHIRINGKTKYLGRFTNIEDAARAYNVMAREHFGEFAKINHLPN